MYHCYIVKVHFVDHDTINVWARDEKEAHERAKELFEMNYRHIGGVLAANTVSVDFEKVENGRMTRWEA